MCESGEVWRLPTNPPPPRRPPRFRPWLHKLLSHWHLAVGRIRIEEETFRVCCVYNLVVVENGPYV